PTAIEELREMREGQLGKLAPYFEGEAYIALGRPREALAAFTETALVHPDLDAAWERAFDLAVTLDDDAGADARASAWTKARPESARAKREAQVRDALRAIHGKQDLEATEKLLAALELANPDDFEVAVAHLEAQRALGRSSAMIATSDEIIRLSQAHPTRLPRALEILMDAFESNLPAVSSEARRVAQALLVTAPSAPGPVRLLAARSGEHNSEL